MFGGSTMWGTGGRDEGTIPAALARELRGHGIVPEITNFGETGYVNTQEVLLLALQLQKGRVPDLVIFYDGINDTGSAFQLRRAGMPHNEFNRVKEFNLTHPDRAGDRRLLFARDVAGGLATTRFLKGLAQEVGGRGGGPGGHQPAAPRPSGRGRRAGPAGHRHLSGQHRAGPGVGERSGFRSLFYWQPTIYEKDTLSRSERGLCDVEHARTRRRPRRSSAPPRVRSSCWARPATSCAGPGWRRSAARPSTTSATFREEKAPIYIDWFHLNELGNEIVGRRMAEDVLPIAE